ncbi:MAG: hypothetical protein WDA41_09635 [Candidatus Neomarinimicrobiota bacterium]
MTMEMIAEGLEKSTQADSNWFTAVSDWWFLGAMAAALLVIIGTSIWMTKKRKGGGRDE